MARPYSTTVLVGSLSVLLCGVCRLMHTGIIIGTVLNTEVLHHSLWKLWNESRPGKEMQRGQNRKGQ